MTSSTVYLFIFNDTATTEIYTLSLHDALPILTFRRCARRRPLRAGETTDDVRAVARNAGRPSRWRRGPPPGCGDRKSTRLNSSHTVISYAVFCLKKKKKKLTNCIIKRQSTLQT